ncbi:MAG: hypothetical protein JXQ73_06955 [Phycisphaerae bacterium]|nr:hypothetical protein [Phycisphaerae bacterium]
MMTHLLILVLAMAAEIKASAELSSQPGTEPLAVISLFNPTAWRGPVVVEIPTGRIASPGLVDWRKVRLQSGHHTIPLAIREGRAHWKTRFVAPVSSPRAEDLLVFACSVPPGEWVRLQILQGSSSDRERSGPLVRESGQATITYPGIRAVIDEATGLLRELFYRGESLLAGPLRMEVAKLSKANPYGLLGAFGPGYAYADDQSAPSVKVNRRETVPHRVRWVSASSSGAMTEVNFLIEVRGGPSMALTYRVHDCGVVDILLDGQPWQGTSPWCGHAAAYVLPLIGKPEALPYLEDRFPFYGFKGYTACVRQTACVRRGTQVGMLELGEETVNGRRWIRRITPFGSGKADSAQDLVEATDEGLIVDVLPVRSPLPDGVLEIACPDSARPIGQMLLKGMAVVGVKAKMVEANEESAAPRLDLMIVAESDGIEPDGFEIRPASVRPGLPQGGSVQARSLNGLYQATIAISAHVARFGASLPTIAGNPVVSMRGGGFGGGQIEVDFPYGSEEEWKRVLENLAVSGMNRFACLGMWGNWKMPVSYTYMPELRSTSPDAYDESSGTKLVEIDQHRKKGLRLTRFLHDRGAGVWLWIPIGCVPTTFAQKSPQAMAPLARGGRSEKIPCFTHPDYRRYLDAFFRELLETYPIQGLFLVRDDNGGLCDCDRCKAYVAGSRTKNAAWEQYLVIYDLLRTRRFTGEIAVYPYFDGYAPRLEPLLPQDLYIVGHGGEPAVLTHDYDRIGLMGDTWLDNLYANFRLPPSPRMRRLLADRGSFWIGGAYRGTELPWESIGRFGREPTATPNTLRYEWASRTFGNAHALAFVRMSQAYERLWEINARYLLPGVWMRLGSARRKDVVVACTTCASRLRDRLDELKEQVDQRAHARWLGHVELFAPFIEYHLHRLDLFARVYDLVLAHEATLKGGGPLPDDARQNILAWYREISDWAAKYDAAMKSAPEGMLTHCRGMTRPYKEWMAGYDQWLEAQLRVKQFAGSVRMEAGGLKAGRPFTLTIDLRNSGACPWIPEVGHKILLSGVAERLGLPKEWAYEGDWMAPGDSRTIKLQGTAPSTSGAGSLKAAFLTPFSHPSEFVKCEINVAWD